MRMTWSEAVAELIVIIRDQRRGGGARVDNSTAGDPERDDVSWEATGGGMEKRDEADAIKGGGLRDIPRAVAFDRPVAAVDAGKRPWADGSGLIALDDGKAVQRRRRRRATGKSRPRPLFGVSRARRGC